MIRVYTTSQGRITQYKNISFEEIRNINNIIWIDLQSPSPEEKEFVEKDYKIEFFTSLVRAKPKMMICTMGIPSRMNMVRLSRKM